jgi:hypothetical protein
VDISVADPLVPTFDVVTTRNDGVQWRWWSGVDFDELASRAAGERARLVDFDGYTDAQGRPRYAGLGMVTSNDLAANAIPLRPGSFASTTMSSGPDGSTTCAPQLISDVWYVFTAQGRGTLTVGVGAQTAHVISAHSGVPGTTSNQIACATNQQGGLVALPTVAGQDYYIRVATMIPFAFTLTTTFTQPNDACNNATVITGQGSWDFGTFGATTDGPAAAGPCGATPENDVWFRWRPDRDGVATLGTCGATFDTVLAVYPSCPSGSAQPIACNDNTGGSCGTASKVVFNVIKSTDYWVRIGGKAGAQGDGTLTASIRCTPDFNADDELTFDDIQLFVQLYNSNDPSADLNSDGEWTFDDIQRFVQLYNAGC